MVKMPKTTSRKKVEPVVEEKPNPFGVLGVIFEKIGPGGMLMMLLVMMLVGSAIK